MKLVSLREVLEEKYRRQDNIKQLEKHAMGDCIHLGKISYSCQHCFLNDNSKSFAVYCGEKCNLKCPVCYYDENREDNELSQRNEVNDLMSLYNLSLDDNFIPKYIVFNTSGESLLYLASYKKFSRIINDIEDKNKIKIYKHIYTNGTLIDQEKLNILKQMRINEIRFHISASNFYSKVFNNMRLAKENDFIITVEEPSLPVNRDKLFESLPILNEIGIKHLNLIEVQVTNHNYPRIDKLYPKGRYYKNALHHLYDEGLVYDIMEEVLNKGYKFSVLDCNSDVERYRQVNHTFEIDQTIMDGACGKF